MMRFQQLIDSLPIFGFFVAFMIVALIMAEVGYRLGRWWQERTSDEKEGPTAMIVGSLLALMSFLLAITMGMASDRSSTRRGIMLAEANSVGTSISDPAIHPGIGQVHLASAWFHLIRSDGFRLMRKFLST